MNKSNNSISHVVTYKNGHFYTSDNKRLVFSEHKEFEIIGNEQDFLGYDEILETHAARSSEIMRQEVIGKYGEESVLFFLPQGTKFHFHFGLGKKKSDVREHKYSFQGVFQEDVYLYKINKANFIDPESWRVAACITSVERSVDCDFELNEPITAESPNKAFALLIGTHFDRQRSTSIKIYDHFYVEVKAKDALKPTNRIIRLTMGQLRKQTIEENKDKLKALLKLQMKKRAIEILALQERNA